MLAAPSGQPPIAAALAGLTTDEARRRIQQFDRNTTAEEYCQNWRRILDKFTASVPLLLEATILLQLALGENVQGAVIAILLVFNATLGFFQESRAASVRRDGSWRSSPLAIWCPAIQLSCRLACGCRGHAII